MTTRSKRSLAALALLLVLHYLVLPFLVSHRAEAADQALYLDSDGNVCDPKPTTATTLFLNSGSPTGTAPKCRDSGPMNFKKNNPWADIGTWTTTPAAGTLSALDTLHAWVGLRNSDDQGTQFDVRAEVYKGAVLITSGLTRCITNVTRNSDLAKEVLVTLGAFTPVAFSGTETLSVKILARIGTTSTNDKCPGPGGSHASATGLRLYYDSANRASGLKSTLTAGTNLPVFTSSPPTPAVAQTPYSYQVSAHDAQGGPVRYQLVQAPTGLTIGSDTGLLQWVPKQEQAGQQPLEIRATDASGNSSSQVSTLTVIPFNLSPTITSVPPTFVRALQQYTYAVTASDPERGAVNFAFGATPPSGMTIDAATGSVRWRPARSAIGSHTIAVTATDALGASDAQSFTLDVIDPDADLQILSPTGTYSASVGQPLSVPLHANFPRAVFSASPLPPNASVNGGTFSFKPTASQTGIFSLSFQASFADMTKSSVVRINVTRSNAPPQITPIAAQTVKEGGQLGFTVQGTDPDGDALTFSAPGLSLPNAYFNTLTHQFSFFPAGGQEGNYQVTFAVSDGRATSQVAVPIQVQPAAGGGTQQLLDLTVDAPQSPTFQSRQTISGSTAGNTGIVPPAQRPAVITALSPSAVKQGATATVDVAGLNTTFAQGASRIDFGDGITVTGLTVLSSISARATITVDRQARVGTRQVRMASGGADAPAIVAFSVQQGAARIIGIVVDPFTGQPLAGATVTIEGTNISVVTDAQGRFEIDDALAGAVTLVVTLPNYSVRQISVGVGTNEAVTLDAPIALDALARPPSIGGTLPRAATVVSVLDRGVTKKGGGLTFEQAKAVISDTLVAVGGIEAGVVDDAGNQLNPKFTGAGDLSLNPAGVARHAKALMSGDVYTLRQFHEALTSAFSFPVGFSLGDFLLGLQSVVDEAWAHPASPESAMAIVLFNEGVGLSTTPPRLTGDTRLNRFQLFLLVGSFLVYNLPNLRSSAERVLTAHGVDFQSQLTAAPAAVLGHQQSPVQDAQAAFTAPPGGTSTGVDCKTHSILCATADLQAKKTFTKIWRGIAAHVYVDAAFAAGFGALLAAGQLLIMGAMFGLGPGGLTAAAFSIGAAAVLGAVAVLMLELVLGWYIALVGASFQPAATVTSNTATQKDGSYVIEFSRSASETSRTANPDATLERKYRYHLYRFPDCSEPADLGQAEYMDLIAAPVEKNPSNLRFVIPNASLKDGPNHFRIVTFQYIHNANVPLVEGLTPYDTDLNGTLSLDEWQRGGQGDQGSFLVADQNGDGVVDKDEFAAYKSSQQGQQPFSTDFEIQPGRPLSPPIRNYLGAPGLNADTYPGSLAADGQTVDNLLIRFEQAPASTFQGHLQFRDLIKTLSREYGINTTSDLEFLLNNVKAFDFADGGTKQSLTLGRDNVLTPVEKTADGQYVGKIATDGEQLANRIFGEQFGKPATPEQIRLGQQLVEGQRGVAITKQKVQMRMENALELGRVITQVKNGQLTEVDVTVVKFAGAVGGLDGELDTSPSFRIQDTVTPQNKENLLKKLNLELSGQQFAASGLENTSPRARAAGRLVDEATLGLFKEGVATNSKTPVSEVETRLSQFVNGNGGRALRGQNLADRLNKASDELRALNEDLRAVQRTANAEPTRINPRSAIEKLHDTMLSLGIRSRSPFDQVTGQQQNALGATFTASWMLLAFLDGIRVQVSDFSECYTAIGGNSLPPERFPPGFIVFPDDTEVNAIIREDPQANAQGVFNAGSLTRAYPGDDDRTSSADAGFPPGFLTTDKRGRVLALNTASAERFGGRIFRFQPLPALGPAPGQDLSMKREFVGAVAYFSLELLTTHPVRPVAMTMGPDFQATDEHGAAVTTQDLFVASKDLISGSTQVLRVPLSLLDTRPSLYPEGGVPARDENGNVFFNQTRQRIVGQPVADIINGQFTGPSDMELGFDPASAEPVRNQNSVLMLSDETSIWAIVPNSATGLYTAHELIRGANRRWSGLAFDADGKFYFADYASGDVFVMRWTDLRPLLGGGRVIDDSTLPTVAFPMARGLNRPADLEVEGLSSHTGGMLLVSTGKGIKPLAMPIVGHFGNDVKEIRIKRVQKEEPVVVDASHRLFRAVPGREDLQEKQAYLAVRRVNSDGSEFWQTVTVELEKQGATIKDLFP